MQINNCTIGGFKIGGHFILHAADHLWSLLGVSVEVQGGGADFGLAEHVPDLVQGHLPVVDQVAAVANTRHLMATIGAGIYINFSPVLKKW